MRLLVLTMNIRNRANSDWTYSTRPCGLATWNCKFNRSNYLYLYILYICVIALFVCKYLAEYPNWWGSQFEEWRLDKEWLWSSMIVPRPVPRVFLRQESVRMLPLKSTCGAMSCATDFDITTGDQKWSKYMSTLFNTRLIIPTVPKEGWRLAKSKTLQISQFCFSLHYHYLEWPDGFRAVPSFWLPAGSHANTITKPGLPMHRCGILSLHHVQSRQLLRQWRDIKSTWGFTNNIGASLDCPVLGFAHAEEGKPSVTTPGACQIPKRG